jgi:hypothetical protein
MTAEMAMYYSAMLRVGFGDSFYRAFDKALEEEDPLSDLTLLLCDCISDVNAVLHILREYTLDHAVDEQVVCDLILADVRVRYDSGEMSRVDVVTTLYDIARMLDKFWEEPWDYFMIMSYDLEMYEDGIINEEVFIKSFDAWWNGGERVDVWELQRKWNQPNRQTPKTGFFRKIRSLFGKRQGK